MPREGGGPEDAERRRQGEEAQAEGNVSCASARASSAMLNAERFKCNEMIVVQV